MRYNWIYNDRFGWLTKQDLEKMGIHEKEHHDHEADVDDSKPLPPNEGLNPAGPKYF